MPDKLPILTSTITCPHCGARKTEAMPTDACLFFYECTGCGKLLQPKAGDCCVFCSYGDVPCPPRQTSSPMACRSAEAALALEIRRGVERPDWSVVESSAARAALSERDARRPALARAWATRLTASQDQVWRKILELFAALGRRPEITEIGDALQLTDDEARRLVRELGEHNLASLDESAAAIAYAYPLTARRTEH